MENFTKDQGALINQIYEEYLNKIFEATKSTSHQDTEVTKEKVEVLRQEKNALMKEVLSEDQHKKYLELTDRSAGMSKEPVRPHRINRQRPF